MIGRKSQKILQNNYMEFNKRAKEILDTYNQIATIYSEKYDSDTQDNNLLDIFISEIKIPNAKILDLGSGTGRTSGYIKSKNINFSIVGIDFSDKMLEISRKNFPSIEFKKESIENFNAEKESFDAVIAQSSLFHLDKEELIDLTKRIYSILKIGGVFGILMQVTEKYQCLSLPEPLNPELIMHLCFYTENDLEEVLIKSGFKIITRQKNEIMGSKISSSKLLIVGIK